MINRICRDFDSEIKFLVAIGFLASVATCQPAGAAIKLPAIISNHMMVQANANPRIWGWSSPSEKIDISYLGKTVHAQADASGKWEAYLGKLKPGQKFDIDLQGENSLSIKDVLAGEVWVCAGQSNMEFPLMHATNAAPELESHTWPQIRFFQVKEESAASALEDVSGSWKLYSPQAAKNWSAVGYFFARELNNQLGEPVGMIQAAVGGTMAHVWMSQDALGKGVSLGATWAQGEKQNIPFMPSCLFNGMINGLRHFTVSGVTWYQGESNEHEAELYRKTFPALIEDWRVQFENPDMPFLFVQLPNFGYKTPPNVRSKWAEVREAQAMALRLKNTAMAVTYDVGDPKDLHPANKKPVGLRLAYAALSTVYHQKVPFRGPTMTSMKTQNGAIVCKFVNADKGLRTRNAAALAGFQVAGADNKYVPANASIEGTTVTISSPMVPNPTQLKYAWGDDPDGNLENGCGLPAPPMRVEPAAPQ